MLYAQLIKLLYHTADHSETGILARRMCLVMDEFANIALPDDFGTILATCRSRGISISIILQNISQLKGLFQDKWESITGNCNTHIYLGGSEQSTREYYSKELGKATINYQTISKSSANTSTNINITGRELMTTDELRVMPYDDCLVLISGERPAYDKKYDLKRHPNYKQTLPGGAEPYVFVPERVETYEDWEVSQNKQMS